MAKQRLDQLLVALGHFPSRERAQGAIMAGLVKVGDAVVTKSGQAVAEVVGSTHYAVDDETIEVLDKAGVAAGIPSRADDGPVELTGKKSAVVKDVTGFVLNRLQYALFHEAAQLVEEGIATAEDVDTLVRTTFGFRLPFFGPFAIADMAGLDVYSFCYASLQTSFPERFATPKALQDLVDAGKLGTKSGAGFLQIPAERSNDLVAYRNKAYVAMGQLLDDLGPSPVDEETAQQGGASAPAG